MQRDDELVSLEKLKDELGSKGYKYFKLLQEDLENMDLILALEKLSDIEVSLYMEEQINALETKGFKLFQKRIDDVVTPEEEQIQMELLKLKETLRQMKVKKLKMEAAENEKKFKKVEQKIKVLTGAMLREDTEAMEYLTFKLRF